MMRRRAGDSADGLVLMTSSVTSSCSADGLSEQSQESAGSLHSDARGSEVVEAISSRKLQCNQQMLFGEAIAKRCRLHKLIRQRFALALKIQQEDFALIFQQSKLQWIQSQRKDFQTQCFEHPDARRFRRSI
ncbi:putative inactive poly [Dorcoceras hygrometricum]|uniref:Putative inactive poly n=1 Tax=Dorcoceras hygrometricum TaxID=472368 RepID=A0A2Z7A2Q3_9LAMI|nr:putative inactive poly [Dorcoceras hygrometricum]